MDAGAFPLALVGACASRVLVEPRPSDAAVLLSGGYAELLSREGSPAGACTACVARFDGETGLLSAAHLGDAGWRLLRGGKVVAGSEDQRHSFYAPYQLSLGGDKVLSDPPEVAVCEALRLAPGDTFMMATDGMFDNLYDDEIEAVIGRAAGRGVEWVVHELLEEVRVCMTMQDRWSPIAARADEEGELIVGGREDDVSVAVAAVAEGE